MDESKSHRHVRKAAPPGVSRRDFSRLVGIGAASLCFGSLLSSCSSTGARSGQQTDEASAGSVLGGTDCAVIALPKESEPAAGFDPLIAWGCGEHVHEPLIQSTLIATDKEMEFINDLATSYACSDDGLVWTFSLRTDVCFSDGAPLTSADVVFTLESALTKENAEADLSCIREVEAADDSTVRISLKHPDNALLHTVATLGIVPAHAYDASYSEHPVGSGRYLLEQWDKGQQVILCANPRYYGKAPQIARVVVLFMDEDAALAAVKAGEVDAAFASAAYSSVSANGFDLVAFETVDSRGISLPCRKPGASKQGDAGESPVGNAVTCDKAVRQAINIGIDRQALIDHVLNGYGTPAYSVADGLPWSSAAMQCDFDPAQAAKLLDEAGWIAQDDGIRAKEGIRCSLSCYYSAGDSVRQAMVTEFGMQMAKIGIEIHARGASWDEIYQHEFSDPVLWGWGSHSPRELYELSHSKGWGNFPCLENGAIDRYLDDALAQTDIQVSYELWQAAQWDGSEGLAPQGEAPWVWLANVQHLYFVKSGLDLGMQKPQPHGHGWSLLNNVDRWRWR